MSTFVELSSRLDVVFVFIRSLNFLVDSFEDITTNTRKQRGFILIPAGRHNKSTQSAK